VSIFTPCDGTSSRRKTGLLLLFRLGPVLVKELEQLSSRVLVEGVCELCNRWRYLQALRKDNFLSLKADVFWPFDEACEISLGLNVLA
jgi:hypothetical protein